jgi:nucleotide-binding universal stress UspA family protein
MGGHRVEVLHVTPPVRPAIPGGVSLTEALRDSGRRLVESVARGLSRKGKAVSRVAESHDVAEVILSRAREARADLVLLGARGLTPLKTFFLGSVSQRVARHADRAVLVARRRPGRALKILAAVDGSPSDGRSLAFLLRLGIPKGSRMTLVHAIADPMSFWVPETGFPGGYGPAAAWEESLRALRERGRRILERARADWAEKVGDVNAVLREGHPAGEILAQAAKDGADLVVMGRHGHSRLDHFLVGSVSQKVLSHAPCSVMIVP